MGKPILLAAHLMALGARKPATPIASHVTEDDLNGLNGDNGRHNDATVLLPLGAWSRGLCGKLHLTKEVCQACIVPLVFAPNMLESAGQLSPAAFNQYFLTRSFFLSQWRFQMSKSTSITFLSLSVVVIAALRSASIALAACGLGCGEVICFEDNHGAFWTQDDESIDYPYQDCYKVWNIPNGNGSCAGGTSFIQIIRPAVSTRSCQPSGNVNGEANFASCPSNGTGVAENCYPTCQSCNGG